MDYDYTVNSFVILLFLILFSIPLPLPLVPRIASHFVSRRRTNGTYETVTTDGRTPSPYTTLVGLVSCPSLNALPPMLQGRMRTTARSTARGRARTGFVWKKTYIVLGSEHLMPRFEGSGLVGVSLIHDEVRSMRSVQAAHSFSSSLMRRSWAIKRTEGFFGRNVNYLAVYTPWN